METKSGRLIDLHQFAEDDVSIEDIAWSLSLLCRWGGHIPVHYSVARHSINCARLCDTPKFSLLCLLHDAHEAYLGDIVRPVAQLLGETKINKIKKRIQRVILAKFGVSDKGMESFIKSIDRLMLLIEAEHFHKTCFGSSKPPISVNIFDSKDSDYNEFLSMFNVLKYKLDTSISCGSF